jgi:hypothetical protein
MIETKPHLCITMHMKKMVLACGIILITVTAGFAAQGETWQPSRKAEDGCVWKPFANEQKGIKLWYQDCKDSSAIVRQMT